MRLYSLLPTLATATVVFSMSVPPGLRGLLGDDDESSMAHHFGAPSPPWEHGAKPGWYYSSENDHHPDLFCFTPPVCKFLNGEGHHYGVRCPKGPPPRGPPPTQPPPTGPPPPVTYDGYVQTFHNLTGATQAGDYMTFGLVNTVDDCLAMCNSVQGCGFANTYHDVNGKDGSPLLTCSLYTSCHNATDATNTGGQSQPDGSIDYIIESDGWCKQ